MVPYYQVEYAAFYYMEPELGGTLLSDRWEVRDFRYPYWKISYEFSQLKFYVIRLNLYLKFELMNFKTYDLIHGALGVQNSCAEMLESFRSQKLFPSFTKATLWDSPRFEKGFEYSRLIPGMIMSSFVKINDITRRFLVETFYIQSV